MKVRIKNSETFNEALIRKGYTKTSFGLVIGLSNATVCQICNGSRNASPITAKKILDVLELGFDEVFEIVKERQE